MVDIVTRAGKGSALTHNELDANFNNLKAGVLAVENTLATQQATIDATLAQAESIAATAEGAAALAQSAAADAASVMQQDLSAIDKTVFSATLVDAFLYDTSKDSDGGAWRKRCSHTSWENETLSGNWLGSAVNEAEARGLGGAVTGSLYYDTTAAVFRTLNAGSGVTAAYRGNTRQFPAKVLITVEDSRLVIWDVTQAGVPMWMVFAINANVNIIESGGIVAVTAMQGVIVIAGSTISLKLIEFVQDRARWGRADAYRGTYKGTLANRNAGLNWNQPGGGPLIVNNTCYDVAMTVLPNAQVDVATGLPIPTIAVATAGGVSVIKDDGNVWDIYNSGGSTYEKCSSVGFTTTGKLIANVFYDSGSAGPYRAVVRDIPGADVTGGLTSGTLLADLYYGNSPSQLSGAEYTTKIVLPSDNGRYTIAGNVGLMQFVPNYSDHALGMTAYVTKDYNSGWQVGAIKGSWLADTVAETLTGTELVSNGDFGTDTTGWTGVNATLSIVSGAMRVTATAGSPQARLAAFTTVVGKTYVLKANLATLSVGGKNVFLAQGPTTAINESSTNMGSTVGLYQLTFVASSTTTYVGFTGASSWAAAEYFDVDAVSCRPADVDRSVKAKGLQVFGSLTKAAVASGAQLMGYSGFSAANFFEQPYNSDLDFGTAAFAIFCPLKEAANSADEVVIERAYYTGGAYSGGRIRLEVLAAGTLKATFSDGTNSVTMTSSATIDDATWKTGIIFGYDGTNFRIVGNGGTDLATATARGSVGSLTNANAVLRVGLGVDGNSPLTNGTLALARSGATWPSAEQIKHIYETERPLFEANAQCCLAGTSNAVTALAYCEETGILHVGTSWGRSPFKDLLRVGSEATAVGAITALSAGAGIVAQAGATAVDVYVPAYLLREELLRDAEQMAKFGQTLYPFPFTATASQTTFTLPVGWEIVMVYQQGLFKTETAHWTRSFDGFKWSVVLVTGATVSDLISILAKRV